MLRPGKAGSRCRRTGSAARAGAPPGCARCACAARRYARRPAPSSAAILPPPLPVSATTRTPSSCAAWIAVEHVARIAAGRDGEQHVAAAPERAHLLGEHLLVGVVVGDRGEGRAVGGERHRGERRALDLEAVEELGGEMLRVGGRAAVAAGEHLAAPLEGFGEERACPRDRLGQRARRVELELGAFGKLRAHARGKCFGFTFACRILHRHSTNTSISMRRGGIRDAARGG